MKTLTQWTVSDLTNVIPFGNSQDQIEFRDNSGEWHHFYFQATKEKIIFGGACNAGFLESGFIEREEFETLDETLQEMLSDLETYYNDGAKYVSRIICNERM